MSNQEQGQSKKELTIHEKAEDSNGRVWLRSPKPFIHLKNVDINKDKDKIVVNKQQSMEKENLIALFARAIDLLKQPSTNANDVINHVREKFEDIENPHRALEQELARLVKEGTPPNGEFYKTRADKDEFAVAFFRRVYGRFYDAKVLRYKSQVQAMDADFAHLLGQYTHAVRLLTRREENDEALARVGSLDEVMRLASVAARRKNARG